MRNSATFFEDGIACRRCRELNKHKIVARASRAMVHRETEIIRDYDRNYFTDAMTNLRDFERSRMREFLIILASSGFASESGKAGGHRSRKSAREAAFRRAEQIFRDATLAFFSSPFLFFYSGLSRRGYTRRACPSASTMNLITES